ncbi:hypothetical protein J6590_081044, partial [Homalodisca vitripennis]
MHLKKSKTVGDEEASSQPTILDLFRWMKIPDSRRQICHSVDFRRCTKWNTAVCVIWESSRYRVTCGNPSTEDMLSLAPNALFPTTTAVCVIWESSRYRVTCGNPSTEDMLSLAPNALFPTTTAVCVIWESSQYRVTCGNPSTEDMLSLAPNALFPTTVDSSKLSDRVTDSSVCDLG